MAQEWQIVRRARRFVDLQFLTLDSGFWPRENPRSSAASSTRERVPKAAIFKISTRKAPSPTTRIKIKGDTRMSEPKQTNSALEADNQTSEQQESKPVIEGLSRRTFFGCGFRRSSDRGTGLPGGQRPGERRH